MSLEGLMAEGEGFEPPVPFQAQRFSRPPVSTAHPSLRVVKPHCSKPLQGLGPRVRRPLLLDGCTFTFPKPALPPGLEGRAAFMIYDGGDNAGVAALSEDRARESAARQAALNGAFR